MATTEWFNVEAFTAALRRDMNRQLQAAAEPIIQQAVADAEQAMRQQLGSMVVGLIEHTMTIERVGPDLRILVKLPATISDQ